MPPEAVRTSQRATWGSRVTLLALGSLLLFAAVVYSTAQFGAISGEEFSPERLERRHFSYYEIPLLGIQVSPVKHRDETGKLESHLVKNNLVSIPANPPDQWDLVAATRGGTPASFGDAQILCNYLDAEEDDKKTVHWLQWTEGHPQAAKHVWPIIIRLAREDLYIFIPKVFSVLRKTDDLDEIKDLINRDLSQAYHDLGQTFLKLNRYDQASELLQGALKFDPDNREIQQDLERAQK